ncbi:SCO1664 family protein [Dermatophilaceae bacterium Sec6.4]|nr:SCO1664 family protein [Actinomycetota bacterium]
MPTATGASSPDVLAVLREGEVEIEGRLVDASNVAMRVWIGSGEDRTPAVYKPIRGEQPLWDFRSDSLAAREVAAFLVSQAGGWDLIPPTVFRDGPLGAGSVQRWVGPLDARPDHELLRVDRGNEPPTGYVAIWSVFDESDRAQVVSHAIIPALQDLAVLDAVLNNADRKASAIIVDEDERLWAIDQGLCFHEEPKLRTCLWGFAGDPLSTANLARLRRLQEFLREDQQVAALLSVREFTALLARCDQLVSTQQYPEVPEGRTPLPWPLW